jgi:hypothetical protein
LDAGAAFAITEIYGCPAPRAYKRVTSFSMTLRTRALDPRLKLRLPMAPLRTEGTSYLVHMISFCPFKYDIFAAAVSSLDPTKSSALSKSKGSSQILKTMYSNLDLFI